MYKKKILFYFNIFKYYYFILIFLNMWISYIRYLKDKLILSFFILLITSMCFISYLVIYIYNLYNI